MIKGITTGVFAICSLVLLLTACGGGADSGLDPAAARFTAELDDGDSIGCNGARLELAALSTDGLRLRLRARRLQGAKVIIGRVHYDPALYHFMECSTPGENGEDGLWLAMDNPERGQVEFGWVLPDFERRRGIDGDLTLGTLRFAHGAAQVSRHTSEPPIGQYNIFDIAGSVDGDNFPTVTWDDTHSGDGNNDGVVNISDMTQIGQQWLKAPGESSQARKADYNRDGQVNISDMIPMGQNWQKSLGGYAIFSGPTETGLEELTRIDRSVQFPIAPEATDGVLGWEWTGAALTEDTYFQVQPYDNTGVLGLASNNTILLEYTNPTPIITDIVSINVPPAYSLDGEGNRIVLITEWSADEITGNAEPFAPESIQLTAHVLIDIDPGEVDENEGLIWYISEGSGRAEINQPVNPDDTGSPGLLTFINRGKVTVTAQVPGDFTKTASVTFVLLSIESVALTSGGGPGPIAANAGDSVPFTAMGTFDWDGISNLNEEEQDITNYCNWGVLSDPPGSPFALDTYNGILDTTGAGGAELRVTCEFPRTEEVTIGDNTRKASNLVTVNVS